MSHDKMPAMPKDLSEVPKDAAAMLNPAKHDPEAIKVGPAPAPSDEPKKKVKPIEVVADRPGFYNQVRLREGDHFEIRSEDDWGEWFHCVEPGMEKKRLAFLKEKKTAAQKRKSGEADA